MILTRSPLSSLRWLKPWFAALLFFISASAGVACPLCMGGGQPSTAQRLVSAPQSVLAVPTEDASRFRVIQAIKGELPADGTVEGGYPRFGPPSAGAAPTDAKPLLLVSDDPLPTWVILGAIDTAQAGWLRTLAAGKQSADMSPEEWRARVALVVPHLHDPDPLAVDLAYGVLAAAPYAALRTAKPHLDAAAFRQWLADPQLAVRQPLCLLLLGISGNNQDATDLEQHLQAAWESGDTANLGCMLAADLELRGAERLSWVELNYLADPKRSPLEIKAVLLALSVHGNANGAIARERVIQSYRVFMKAHPQIAGYVAPDLAAWQYWDAVPDYLALLKSGVRQQYPAQLAILVYLQKSPNAKALGFSPAAAPADGKAERWKPGLGQW